MKIGIILNSEPYIGGTFQYNETILDALNYVKNKIEDVEIVAAYDNILWQKYLSKYKFKSIKTNLKLNRAYINNLEIDELRNILPEVHIGAKTMVDEKCDIWFCPSQDFWSFVLDVPIISTIHDLMHRYEKRFPEVYINGEYEYRELLYSNMCKYSKKIIVDSQCGKDQVIESYNIKENNIEILPFIPPKYIFNEELNIDVRKKFNIQGKYIFYPAQFWEHKNHLNLLKAIDIVKKDIPDIMLVLCGSTKYSGYEKCLNVIKNLKLENNVNILGYVPEKYIVSLYKMAEMMIMPTFFGPTNIPPLEAMALKCPMAVSKIYGMPEQLGKASLYFDPNSPEDIAKCILEIYTDKAVKYDLIKNCSIELEKHSSQQFYNKFFNIVIGAINN